MRGVYMIDRETSDGDRAIVATIDIEGLLCHQDALEVAKSRADEALEEGGVYKVRVIHDDGWYCRTHATRIAGLSWKATRYTSVAAMQEP